MNIANIKRRCYYDVHRSSFFIRKENMAKKEGSIRKRGNNYELRVQIDGVAKSFYGKSESEARKKLREYRTGEDKIRYSNELVQSYVYNWLVNYKFGIIKDSSYDILERVYKNQIHGTWFGNLKMKNVTHDEVQQFFNEIASKNSISILKKVREILSPSFKLAIAKNDMKSNPLDLVVMPTQINRQNNIFQDNEISIYTEQEIVKIYECCMGNYGSNYRDNRRYRYAPCYLLLLNTGMRVGEMAALTWKDIDFNKKTIRVCKTVSCIVNRGRYDGAKKINIITTAKTKNSNRFIPMNENVVNILHILKERQTEFGIVSEYVVPNLNGSFMQVRVLEQTFQRICEENLIQYKGLHALRHTFGSILIKKGMDIKIVSELLGHSTVQFTYDRYIHIILEQKAQAIKLLEII